VGPWDVSNWGPADDGDGKGVGRRRSEGGGGSELTDGGARDGGSGGITAGGDGTAVGATAGDGGGRGMSGGGDGGGEYRGEPFAVPSERWAEVRAKAAGLAAALGECRFSGTLLLRVTARGHP